jgi:peptide deformylase
VRAASREDCLAARGDFVLTGRVPVLEIRKFPDPVLQKKAAPVRNIDGRVAGLVNSMVDTMYAANGLGLAAPQVGSGQRILVMDTDPDNRGKELIKIVNPVIVESSGEITWEEGCLSLVNITVEMTRAQRVLLRGWTLDQREIELEAQDLKAVCIQHELDHLDGTLLVDHISRLKRELYRKRLKKGADKPEPELSPLGNDVRRI